MSVNESDLPQFRAGPETPIGQISGIQIATKKQGNTLMKRLLSHAKPTPKAKAKAKPSARRSGRRGIEGDNKVHFQTLHKYY